MPSLNLRAYGRTVTLAGPKSALATARERLPGAYRDARGPAERRWSVRKRDPGGWEVLVEGELLTYRPDVLQATESMLGDLELWVAERAAGRVFVHGGCAAVNGRAVIFPGRSMSGKSSIVAALVRAGAIYYSDEYAVLDHRGLVRPYPRPLGIRSYVTGISRPVAVEEIGGRVGHGPARVGLIASIRYDPCAGWQSKPLTPGQATLRLLDNAVAARSRPRAALTAFERATVGALAFAGTRGEAEEAATVLMNMLSS